MSSKPWKFACESFFITFVFVSLWFPADSAAHFQTLAWLPLMTYFVVTWIRNC